MVHFFSASRCASAVIALTSAAGRFAYSLSPVAPVPLASATASGMFVVAAIACIHGRNPAVRPAMPLGRANLS